MTTETVTYRARPVPTQTDPIQEVIADVISTRLIIGTTPEEYRRICGSLIDAIKQAGGFEIDRELITALNNAGIDAGHNLPARARNHTPTGPYYHKTALLLRAALYFGYQAGRQAALDKDA